MEKTPMSAAANKALVRRFYEEIDKGNLDAMDELVDPDYLDHPPPFQGLPPGREGQTGSLRNGIERNCVFGAYRAPVTKDSVDSIASESRATIRIWMPQDTRENCD
jgi:hypothetical protein